MGHCTRLERDRLEAQATDLCVKVKTFGFMPLTRLFAVAQASLIMRTETKDSGR